MGPNTQFIMGLPNSNADRKDPNFYRFSDSKEDRDRDVHGDSDHKPQYNSDGEGNANHNVAILHDDPGLQTLLEEHVLFSQPDQYHFFIAKDENNNDSLDISNRVDDAAEAKRHRNLRHVYQQGGDEVERLQGLLDIGDPI
jgi:hypothetical protein